MVAPVIPLAFVALQVAALGVAVLAHVEEQRGAAAERENKNRDRLLEADIARRFFREVVDQARGGKLLSDEHFSVDGTLIQVWASTKRLRLRTRSRAQQRTELPWGEAQQ